jgi:VanZ family protein
MTLIFYLSSQSSMRLPLPSFRGNDKLAHCMGYSALAGMLVFALWNFDIKQRLALAVLASALYGLSDELHQSFVPGRHGDPFDIFADCVGSVLGACGAVYLQSLLCKRGE